MGDVSGLCNLAEQPLQIYRAVGLGAAGQRGHDGQSLIMIFKPDEAMLRCSKCGIRELVDLDEAQIQTMLRSKGVVRDCPTCGATALWKRLGVQGL